jgi:hypothetical protein
MSSGLLPSLREYAARYGLTGTPGPSPRPEALVMHPGPMNEGVEIAPDVAAGPSRSSRSRSGTGSRCGWRCSTCSPGPSVVSVAAALAGEVGGRRRPRDLAALARRPGDGREGPGEIVVTDGVLEAVDWLDATRPTGSTTRRRRRARVRRPPRPLPRARQRGRRDDRVRSGGRGPRRVHDGLPDAEHDAGARRPGRPRPGRAAAAPPGRRSGPRLGRVTAGGRRDAGRLGELADAGVVGFSDDGRRCRRRRCCGTRSPTPAPSGCRSSTTPRIRADRRRRGERRLRRDRARAARLAGRGRGAAVARDLAILAEVVRDVPGRGST